jgi:hypothetical protein
MGSHAPGTYIRCYYCEYCALEPYLYERLEGTNITTYVLCDWCSAFLVEIGKPDSEMHWWSTRRWRIERWARWLGRQWNDRFAPEVHVKIAEFLIPRQERFQWRDPRTLGQ